MTQQYVDQLIAQASQQVAQQNATQPSTTPQAPAAGGGSTAPRTGGSTGSTFTPTKFEGQLDANDVAKAGGQYIGPNKDFALIPKDPSNQAAGYYVYDKNPQYGFYSVANAQERTEASSLIKQYGMPNLWAALNATTTPGAPGLGTGAPPAPGTAAPGAPPAAFQPRAQASIPSGTLGAVRSGPFSQQPQLPQDNSIRRVGINPNEAAFKAQAPEFLRNMSYDISSAYNPDNPWAPGANVEQGLSFDYNGPEGAGGESFLYPHPGGTGEIRDPEGDWGVGFNATGQAGYGNIGSPASSILQSNGYNPSGDPIADAALAGRIVAMQNAGASTEEYRPEANPTSPSDTLMNPWGAPEQAGADLAYSSFTLGNNELQLAAEGAEWMTNDPTLHENLVTGERIMSSEYGQPETTTITPAASTQPVMSAPGLPEPTFGTGTTAQTGAYGSAPTQGFLGEAPRQQQQTIGTSSPQAPAPTVGPNTPYRSYEQNYDSRGNVIYTPAMDRQTYAWQQSPYNPVNNYPAGNRFPEPRPTTPPTSGPNNPPIFGGPVPEVPGGGGPGPGPGGGGGGGGTWPPIPNPPPTPATDFQTDFARRQRQRDIEAQYYPQFGLPRPRGVEVNDPTGLNAPPGLYYESPDYGSALQGMQQQLSLLGNVGNSQQLQAQIQQLYSGLTGGPEDAGARTQIAQLQQQLSKAQQAEEIQRQMGVLQSQTNYLGAPMGGAYGDMAGGGMANPMAPTDANALAPATMAAPDISNEDFRWMSRPYPMELARLLQLDNAITQYGDANPEAIRQAEEMVSGIQDPNGQQRATMLLQRVIARLNNGRAPSPGLNMSVLPDDPWAALAVAKYGSAA